MALRAPSAIAADFSQAMLWSVSLKRTAEAAKPRSAPAMTFSRPTILAKRSRSAITSGCSTRLVVWLMTRGIGSGRGRCLSLADYVRAGEPPGRRPPRAVHGVRGDFRPRRLVPFDHAYELWQDRRTMPGGVVRAVPRGKKSAGTEKGPYVTYDPTARDTHVLIDRI